MLDTWKTTNILYLTRLIEFKLPVKFQKQDPYNNSDSLLKPPSPRTKLNSSLQWGVAELGRNIASQLCMGGKGG